MTEKNSKLDRPWITGLNDIAEQIGCHRNAVPGLIRTEGLPAFKFLGKWRILPEDVQVWTRKIAGRVKRTGRTR